jgi:hypothetical protein
MNLPKCHGCDRQLTEGEMAWAYDWKVWDQDLHDFRAETRYTCDDCVEAS